MISIRGIAIKHRPRVAMQLIDSAQISVHSGILGDLRGCQAGRQITFLSECDWFSTCAALDVELPWTTRRANFLIGKVSFDASFIGKSVRIGQVELLVTQETTPCSLMDALQPGLTRALQPNWRGGICCNVIRPGHVKIGDQVEFS